ncbi:MAG: peptidylprolyl isomerase [Bacteroidota bacterium]
MDKFFLLLLLVLLVGCEQKPTPVAFDEGKTLALINGEAVTEQFFQTAYVRHIIRTGTNDTPQERYAFLESLIDDFLFAQYADSLELDTTSAYSVHMDMVQKKGLADVFYNRNFKDTLSLPTDDQVRRGFFASKQKLYVSQLFFTEQSRIEEAYNRLEAGEDFVDLANEYYNISPYDTSAGYLGEISYFNVDDAIGEVAFRLKSGEYSEPVRSRFGWHIIKVDNRIGNPMVTESEFQYKKDGYTGKTKLRILNLKGDAFVRNYMQSIDFGVDTSVVEQLFYALSEINPVSDNGLVEIPRQNINQNDVSFLEEELNPDTPVLSYRHFGEAGTFTAGEYFNWLKFLSLKEAQNRTMASVGRALRNQVFYEAGLNQGLEDDPLYQYQVRTDRRFYLTWAAKQYLRNLPVPEIPVEEQKAAFTRLKMNTLKTADFSGWVITFDTFEEAQQAKSEITEGKDPSLYGNFFEYEKADYRKVVSISNYVFKVPMKTVSVVGANKKFYVAYLTERNAERRTFEEAQQDVIQKMEPLFNMVQESVRLRKQAVIRIDTTAFESLMEYYNDPRLTNQYAR